MDITTVKKYRTSIALVLVWLVARALIALCTSLGNDEVYYTLYALTWDLSYFDHPGLLAWVLNLFTAQGSTEVAFLYRFPALLASVANVWLLHKLVKQLKPAANTETIVLWACSSLYLAVVAGLFILPDSVQLTPFIASVLFFVLALQNNYNTKYLLLAFGFSGLAFLGKYHALFLPFGFVLFALFADRTLWKKPAFYLGGGINLLFLLPVFIWNEAHDFISFTFHGNRVGFLENGFNFTSFLQFNLGELFYNNPLTVIASLWALVYGLKHYKELNKSQVLILFVALPMILVFTVLSASKTTLPHWSGAAFVLLIVFMLSLQTESLKWFQKAIWAKLAFGFVFVALGLGLSHVKTGVFGQKSIDKIATNPLDNNTLGKNDFTLDLYNWPEFAEEIKTKLDSIYPTNIPPIISHKWFPAAHLDFYLAKPHHLDFYCLGEVQDIHQYLYLNKLRHYNANNQRLCYLALSTQFKDPKYLIADFPNQELVGVVPQYRGGKIVRLAYIYSLSKAL